MNFDDNITHRIKLWITNDNGWYDYICDGIDTDTTRQDVADFIEEAVNENLEESISMAHPMVTEIAETALAYVDWDEIAAHYDNKRKARQEQEDVA